MKLPDLPDPDLGATERIPVLRHSLPQIRAIQRAAALWALEEAAKVCEELWPEMHKYWGPGQARAACEDCAAAIRALKEKIE